MLRRYTFTARVIVRYAEAYGNRAAGREYSTSEANVRNWRKDKAQMQAMPSKKSGNIGQLPHFPGIERAVVEFVTERRKEGLAVSTLVLLIPHKDSIKTTG